MTGPRGLPPSLLLPGECFSAEFIARRSREHGFAQPNTLEALLWGYEIFAQLQERVGAAARLTGGAATQLFVSPDRQRASVDIDILTSLPKAAMGAHLAEIGNSLGAEDPYFAFESYVPLKPSKAPGLYSYTVLVPSAVGQKWRLQDGWEIEARMIKVDFHEMSELPPEHSRPVAVAGIDLKFQALCVSRGYLVAEKLLTQARNTVGVPDSRYEDLPKHLYDLDALTLPEEDGQLLGEAAQWLPELVVQQGQEWRGGAQLVRVLKDLETSLEPFAVIDYIEERQRFARAVQQLETLYLPRGSRWRLHQWATKAARMLAFARLTRRAVLGKVPIREGGFETLEALAGKVRAHEDPSGLSKALWSRLPLTLQQIRPMRGSPPERLFWLLADEGNLSWLSQTVP
ncbi:MAG: nucleotidyl transferase AbiEii/AbiGii toxin family protein [Chloroflexota bacterium]